MKVAPLLMIWLGATLGVGATGQIERSGALDADSSDCRGLTCTWASAKPIHQHIAGYKFYLDPVPDDSPGSLVVESNGKQLLRSELKDISASVTITCGPSCDEFAVTWSDGGVIGRFHTKLFRLDGSTFVEIPAVQRALNHFRKHHDCKTRGDNEQAYRFEAHGRELMLILSVYNTSDCGLEMGHTEGYLMRTK